MFLLEKDDEKNSEFKQKVDLKFRGEHNLIFFTEHWFYWSRSAYKVSTLEANKGYWKVEANGIIKK